MIELFMNEEGIECRGEKEVAGKITKYFEKLFTSKHPRDCDEILEGIPRTITESMNGNLTRTVENQQIKNALFSMNPNKALGLDDMSHSFF